MQVKKVVRKREENTKKRVFDVEKSSSQEPKVNKMKPFPVVPPAAKAKIMLPETSALPLRCRTRNVVKTKGKVKIAQ